MDSGSSYAGYACNPMGRHAPPLGLCLGLDSGSSFRVRVGARVRIGARVRYGDGVGVGARVRTVFLSAGLGRG